MRSKDLYFQINGIDAEANFENAEYQPENLPLNVPQSSVNAAMQAQPKRTNKPRMYSRWVIYKLDLRNGDLIVFAATNKQDCENVAALKKLASPTDEFIVAQARLTTEQLSNFSNKG